MTSTNKSFCNIHFYRYNGNKCPFCEQERIQSLCRKYCTTEKKKTTKSTTNQITDGDLKQLMTKFNG